MSIFTEYIKYASNEKWLVNELKKQLKRYNDLKNTNLLLYFSSTNPRFGVTASMERSDFYTIFNFADGITDKRQIDIYVETPGGNPVAAVDIAAYFREHFENITYVVCGEAKSSGTILVLSGDEVIMTKTGSLGPIDTQVFIRGTQVSTYDYMRWIEAARQRSKFSDLDKVDEIILANITPGEIEDISNSLNFAKESIEEWFEHNNLLQADDDYEKVKATDVSKILVNNSMWKVHGRSIKIHNLKSMGLDITHADDNEELANVIYRIHNLCLILSEHTPQEFYKIIGVAGDLHLFPARTT